jgi:NAD+ synthase (glutamine-hydrolysing)
MNRIHVAAAVLNQTPLAWRPNLQNIRQALAEARRLGIELLCLPELCTTGYGCEDAFHSPNTLERAWRMLQEVLPECHGLVACIGLPVLHQNALFNCAALVVDGRITGLVAKRFLAGDGIHYEPRWFKPWPQGVRDDWHAPDGSRIPIGDIHFDVGGVRIGFEICEDAWVANRPGAGLAQAGVDVILNPSASHFAFGKLEVRKRFVLEGSRAFGTSYLYANLLGNEAGRAIYDGGALIASNGRLIAVGPRFTFDAAALTHAFIDVDLTRMSQTRSGSFQPGLAREHPLRVEVNFAWHANTTQPATTSVDSHRSGSWESSAYLKEEEFTRALVLALFDYLRKSRSNGFVISLSGGADSAAVTCLCAMAIRLAFEALGADGIRERLGHIPCLPPDLSPTALCRMLITTAYQATENSGDTTRNAARSLAASLGVTHHELDVSVIHRTYVELIQSALGKPLDWARDDVALQNIQARVRSPGIWLIANLRNALLLSTSNRSEAAVGYATMDGDTSGGLCPVAGIDKAFLLQWLRWMECHGPAGVGALACLAPINCQAPTAELRPPAASQTDEADLMPYPILDAIERAAIRDKRSPAEVLELMQATHPESTPEQLRIWVTRFFRLWSRNQWKRERYAPSFHLDDENLDPKTWCRWPILSGGFEQELAELSPPLN